MRVVLLAMLVTGCAPSHPSDPFLELEMSQPAFSRVSVGDDVISGETGAGYTQRWFQWDDQWHGHALTWQIVVRGKPGAVADLAGQEAAGMHWLNGDEDCRPTVGTVSWMVDDVIEFDATCPDGTRLVGALSGRLVTEEWGVR